MPSHSNTTQQSRGRCLLSAHRQVLGSPSTSQLTKVRVRVSLCNRHLLKDANATFSHRAAVVSSGSTVCLGVCVLIQLVCYELGFRAA